MPALARARPPATRTDGLRCARSGHVKSRHILGRVPREIHVRRQTHAKPVPLPNTLCRQADSAWRPRRGTGSSRLAVASDERRRRNRRRIQRLEQHRAFPEAGRDSRCTGGTTLPVHGGAATVSRRLPRCAFSDYRLARLTGGARNSLGLGHTPSHPRAHAPRVRALRAAYLARTGRGQRPRNLGLRLSTNDLKPSLVSSVS